MCSVWLSTCAAGRMRLGMHGTQPTSVKLEADIYAGSGDAQAQALSEVLPTVARHKTEKGGFMVLRPDSGDPVEAVLMGLEAGEKVFGIDTNALGYKVPRGAPCLVEKSAPAGRKHAAKVFIPRSTLLLPGCEATIAFSNAKMHL